MLLDVTIGKENARIPSLQDRCISFDMENTPFAQSNNNVFVFFQEFLNALLARLTSVR